MLEDTQLDRRRFLLATGLAAAAPLVGLAGGAAPAAAASYPFSPNVGLVNAFQMRRGTIGTGGKPAVAFRCDHHLNKFKQLALPLHKKHNIPVTIAVGSRTIERETGSSGSDQLTWGELEALCIANGFEIGNHGATHADASTSAELQREVVDSRDSLRRKMPKLPVELWVPPGTSGTRYGGLLTSPMTLDRFGTTLAGRTILQSHAVSTGYVRRKPYGYLWPMTGNPLDSMGATHITSDEGGSNTGLHFANGPTYLKNVAANGGGACFMYHPHLLGSTDLAKMDQFLAYCAAERNAGRLEILTVSGLMMADYGSSVRHDLLGGDGAGFAAGANGWSVASAKWTLRTSGATVYARRAATSGPLAKTVSVGLHGGSSRELRLKMRSSTGVTVRIKLWDPATKRISVVKDVRIYAGTTFKSRYLHVTLPLGTEKLTVSISPRTTGELHVQEPRLLAT